MSPSRRVLAIALFVVASLAAMLARPASAQFYDPTVRSLDLSPEGTVRSPRLLGMGSLGLVIDDPSYRFDLWDYAQNPLGIAENDSVSTIELWGRSDATASMRGLITRVGERQTLAGRASEMPIEVWRRNPKAHSVYGLAGRVQGLRQDIEAGEDIERRRVVNSPSIMPVIAAPFPWLLKGKLDYAVRLQFGGETVEDRFRHYVTNPAGDFLDLEGQFATEPNIFTPRDWTVVTQGAGVGLGWKLARAWKLALMGDVVRHRIEGHTDLPRSSSELSENRPYATGQATLIGRLGTMELAADGRAWRSNSEQAWRFSLSAGTGADPLAGRGKLLERVETGTSLDTRARWVSGPLTLGASVNTRYSKVEQTPPIAGDPTSLNYFLDRIYRRAGVDTLALPDSVLADTQMEHGVGFGLGSGWAFPRGVAGAEFHWRRNVTDSHLVGNGPKRIDWDFRGGLEYKCNPVVTGRLGYVYRSLDQDDLTRSNEWVGHTGTLGFGLHPSGTSWVIEAGYALQLNHADYGDPALPHGNRQSLSTQVRWDF